MSLSIVTGVHASGNPSASVALSGSISIGQVILLWAAGGGLPGSQTVSDNVNSGNYTLLASYGAGNMVLYWKIANATGTPTVSIASTGGFADIWAAGVTGFVGTPTADTSIVATATGTGTALAINATSNFANEIMLMNVNYSTSYLNPVTANPWSLATTATDSNFNAFYAIEATPTANNFSGTIAASQTWFLQLAGIYDAPVSNVASIAWVS